MIAELACGAALSLILPRSAVGQQGKTLPVFVNGQAQIVPEFQDPTQWIRQDLWVESEFDSDGDGKPDRIHIDITRPRQTEIEGLKVPVIYEASPYYSREYSGRPDIEEWNVKQEVGAVPPPRALSSTTPFAGTYSIISTSLVQTWVPRGFAVVHSESPGTGLSQGCPTIGGDNESLAPKAVIDWLNGRARAFTTIDGNEQIVASWSTGNVGMIGTSYDGTLALAAATTGVEGLKAIIPVAPVSSFYEYYRSNGLVRHPAGYLGEDIDVLFDAINTGRRSGYCAANVRDREIASGQDRLHGDYNAFWATHDYLAKVNKIKAAVLMAHGFNDWNVMPEQSVRIYEALKKQHVPIQAFYHQDGHGGDPPLEQMNRWFTRYLYDIKNGVEKDPRAWIVREGAEETNPTPYADYPNPAATAVTLHLQRGGNGTGGLGIVNHSGQGKETLTDDVTFSPGALVRAEHSNDRLLYATPVLTEAVHLSGWSTITIRLASSKPAANLSVYIVALPSTRDSNSTVKSITRGWADPQNYKSLAHGEPMVPGRFYTMNFNLQPEDRVIPAGTRIGLMIFSSDRDFTLWPSPGTELTIDVDATSVVLPIVGGVAALKRAL
jgi:X-Pro dipeptidyl-peptidase